LLILDGKSDLKEVIVMSYWTERDQQILTQRAQGAVVGGLRNSSGLKVLDYMEWVASLPDGHFLKKRFDPKRAPKRRLGSLEKPHGYK
jgi:hypothetical protein